MFKKGVLMMIGIIFLLVIGACGDKADEEIDVLLEVLKTDQSADALVDLIELAYEEEPYEEELDVAYKEASKTINVLQSPVLSTKKASKLRDLYVSSIEDFQLIIQLIETNGPNISEEKWAEIGKISEEANEKQMKLINEKLEKMDVDIPAEMEKDKNP